MFEKQPIFCPSCGARHLAEPEGNLCCGRECRRAMNLAHSRYVLGKPALNDLTPLAAMRLGECGNVENR